LPLDPNFAGSNPDEDDGFLSAIEIRGTTSLGGEVKQPVPCSKTYSMLKNPYRYENKYFVGKQPFFANFILLRYQMTLLVIARELWWMNQK
jgi:hypothetical protein